MDFSMFVQVKQGQKAATKAGFFFFPSADLAHHAVMHNFSVLSCATSCALAAPDVPICVPQWCRGSCWPAGQGITGHGLAAPRVPILCIPFTCMCTHTLRHACRVQSGYPIPQSHLSGIGMPHLYRCIPHPYAPADVHTFAHLYAHTVCGAFITVERTAISIAAGWDDDAEGADGATQDQIKCRSALDGKLDRVGKPLCQLHCDPCPRHLSFCTAHLIPIPTTITFLMFALSKMVNADHKIVALSSTLVLLVCPSLHPNQSTP